MKILFVASEAVPFCKTGGLADVVGALTQQMAKRKHDVVLILPYYRAIKESSFPVHATTHHFSIPLNQKWETVDAVELTSSSKVRTFFLRADGYFDREGIYGEFPGTAYPDNHLRYALFCRAALELCKKMNFQPDVIHAHDWQTGLVPAYLKISYQNDPFFASTSTLFSIHNMAYQGNFSRDILPSLDLPPFVFQPDGLEFYGEINFLKSGLYYSDGISTVSETYAKEIMSLEEYGRGFEGLLYQRRKNFLGILNGLDIHLWNPQTDPYLPENFEMRTVRKRALCKMDLQKQVGFEPDPAIPLLGFVGRLDHQKGIDILVDCTPGLVSLGCQMIYLGVGDPYYRAALDSLRHRFPKNVFIENGFAEPMAHRIYGGSDIFLMPSRFEPCGLSQLIAMRYGAVPIVTPTGGLVDTVDDVNSRGHGTGFVAAEKTYPAFFQAAERAVMLYHDKKKWKVIQRNAMKKDSSWRKSVSNYLKLYEKLSDWRRARIA